MIGGVPCYTIFGLTIASELPLPGLDPDVVAASPDVLLSRSDAPLLDERAGAPLYSSAYHTDTGESRFRVYAHPEGDLVRFAGAAEYLIGNGFVRCYPLRGADPGLVSGIFTGAVLSHYLERRGILAIHASVVSVNGQAVGFLSHAGAGKSTLAASFAVRGHPLLSDDILALEPSPRGFLARPGYPLMRLYPPEAQHFLGHYEDLPRVVAAMDKRRLSLTEDGPIPYCRQAQPLGRLFLPVRLPPDEGYSPPQIAPMSPRDALIELVRHSFAARLAECLGLQATRLPLLAQVAETVPCHRLTYPSGFEHLPTVCDAVLATLDETDR